MSEELDLTDSTHLDTLLTEAEALEAAVDSSSEALALAAGASKDDGVAIPARVALKLAISRLLLRELSTPTHVSVVFAVYREHERLLRPDEHPLGEDALRRKLGQLRWLFGPTPRHSWDLTVVDDGCPVGSGALAEEILREALSPDEEARVLHLEDAIAERLPIVSALASAADSQKGGAIRLGLWHAAQNERASDHVVVFTDADLSTHLGQVGLLVSPLAEPGCRAAVGSRRHPASVVIKSRSRDDRGKLFIYLWKRLLPQLRGVVDTQCGFKAFRARHVKSWIEDTRDNGFSFDIEALVRVSREGPSAIRSVPIAWIDSEAASTTAELDPYLAMLKSVVEVYRLEPNHAEGAEPFARLIEGMDPAAFTRLVERVPDAIAAREPKEFDAFDGVSAEALAEAAGV